MIEFELSAEARRRLEEARHASVDAVEGGGNGDQGDGELVLVLHRHADGGEAGAKRQQRHQIGQHQPHRHLRQRSQALAALGIVRIEWLEQGHRGQSTRTRLSAVSSPKRAMTVSPAIMVWPSATSTLAATGR